MSQAHNPYGDGQAAGRIVEMLLKKFLIRSYSPL
jgi:UDP-N-acetylglucosamine 2-epimerase